MTRMPSAKWFAAVLTPIVVNVALLVGANTDVFDPIPDPWRTLIVTAVTGAVVYLKAETRPAPSSWAKAAELHQAGH